MRKTERLALMIGLGVILGVVLWGCSRRDDESAFAPVQRGEAVYEQNCKACHDAENLQLLKEPPRLNGMFTRRVLPSGAPATDDEVRKTILGGRGIMPPFGQTLDKQEVEDLLKYLHKL